MRANFTLEDVSAGREWHFSEFESAAERLALRVRDVTQKSELG